LRSFLKYAAHHDLTAIGVIEQALSVPMKRFEKPMLGFLTREEMRAILEAPNAATWAGRRDRALFNVMYNTGARVSEAIGLRLHDIVTVDGSAAVHLLGKGRKQRSVPLWKPTTVLLRDWIKRLSDSRPETFLFPNRNGGRLTRSNVTQRLDRRSSAPRRPSLGSQAARYPRTRSATPPPCTCFNPALTSR
jgi:integrase/recombinase XerD